jgi:hypothetical protein
MITRHNDDASKEIPSNQSTAVQPPLFPPQPVNIQIIVDYFASQGWLSTTYPQLPILQSSQTTSYINKHDIFCIRDGDDEDLRKWKSILNKETIDESTIGSLQAEVLKLIHKDADMVNSKLVVFFIQAKYRHDFEWHEKFFNELLHKPLGNQLRQIELEEDQIEYFVNFQYLWCNITSSEIRDLYQPLCDNFSFSEYCRDTDSPNNIFDERFTQVVENSLDIENIIDESEKINANPCI